MDKFNTKNLFDRYFSELDKDENYKRKIRPQIDRPEVYEYEDKIGKSIFDMDVDELFEMIMSFKAKQNVKQTEYSISLASFEQVCSLYRAVFNWYIDNVRIIKNPFYDKQMRGSQAFKKISETKSREPFTKDNMEEIISQLHYDLESERADYIECIMRLYYDGFAHAREIVELKEEMIDFTERKIRVAGKVINLSDRTFELLIRVHDSTEMPGRRGNYLMMSWHGNFFKYPIRPKSEYDFKDRPQDIIEDFVNRLFIDNVRKRYQININARSVYLLGFYEFLKSRFGEDRSKEIVMSVRDSNAASDLLNTARMYGIVCDNVTQLKKMLRPFV